MTTKEYNDYIVETFNEALRCGVKDIVFDKPVRIVNDKYRTETEIKSLYRVVIEYNKQLSQLVNFIYKHDFTTDDSITYDNNHGFLSCALSPGLSEVQECVLLPGNCLFYNIEQTELTLTFKNLTFADYYTKFSINDYQFNSLDNVVLANIDFNNITNCDMLFGECNSCKSVTLRSLNMPFVKRCDHMFIGEFDHIEFDNVSMPRVKSFEFVLQRCRANSFKLGNLEDLMVIHSCNFRY